MKVLEFGTYLSAPLLGKYLVDIDYDVTCIERPKHSKGKHEEDTYMKLLYSDLQKGKKKKTLDLPSEKNLLNDLLKNTDIILENFGNNVSKKRSFDFEYCKSINPNIIYISLPGYSKNDKEFENTKAWDGTLMASSGVFCDMGLNRILLGIKASYSSLPLPSVYGSIYAFFVLMCVIRANRFGEYFEVPLASSLMEALVHNSISFPLDKCYMNSRKKTISEGLYPVSKEKLNELFDPFFRKYTCKDGKLFYLVCPAHINHHKRTLQILNIEEQVLNIIKPVNVYSEKFNYGLGCGNVHEEHSKIIYPILKNAFLKRTSKEWEYVFGKELVPAISMKSKEDWIHCDHAIESGLISHVDGQIKVGPIGWKKCTHVVPIKENKHRLEKCLSGLKVLDLTNVIAGPTISCMMARMGAEVLKIDSPKPLYAPDIPVIYGIPTNIGKKSILVDIKSKGGRKILEKLIKDYDILTINCTHEALERLKLTSEDIRKLNPNMILVHFDAWSGSTESGEYANYIGYDDNVQAGIGIMSRFGGSLIDSEEHAHVGTIDVIAGVACAAMTINSIIEREKKGRICTVRTSLVSVGQYVQYPLIFRENETIGKGIDCKGDSIGYCCYETQDGWIFMGVSPTSNVVQINGTEFTSHQVLKSFIKKLHTSNLHKYIQKSCYCKLETMEFLRNKYSVQKFNKYGPTYQFLTFYDHPIGVLQIIAPVSTRLELECIVHSPKYGKDTKLVLKKINCEKYLYGNDVSCSWSKYYMPYSTECQKCSKKGLKLISLSCGHKLCFYCLGTLENVCHVCNKPHETSVENLDIVLREWKKGYKQWRNGLKDGSKGIESVFLPK